jgi:hypothetical protein
MPYDYNAAPPPREFELIPAGTIASISMKVRPGGVGEGGYLKRSKDGGCEMLDLELVVLDGPFARRNFWMNMILAGTTDGHAQAAEISRSTLRSIIESARGIKPNDLSPEARTARTVEIAEFDGMGFVAKIGVEKGKPKGNGENYSDKNILVAAITPDRHDWHQVAQSPASPSNGNGAAAPAASNTGSAAPAAAAAPAISKPNWA